VGRSHRALKSRCKDFESRTIHSESAIVRAPKTQAGPGFPSGMTAGAALTAEALVDQVSADKQKAARHDEQDFGDSLSKIASHKNEAQRRTKDNQDTALAVQTDSPADAHGSQSNRNNDNHALEPSISQKTKTKQGQNRGREGQPGAMNRAQERNACPEPVDMGDTRW
jgi:hypothetical protein